MTGALTRADEGASIDNERGLGSAALMLRMVVGDCRRRTLHERHGRVMFIVTADPGDFPFRQQEGG